MEEVPANSEDSAINPIDYYRHFLTDEIISLMVRETNRYAEQHLQTQKFTKRSKTLQWKPTNNEEMVNFYLKSFKIRCQEIDSNYFHTNMESRCTNWQLLTDTPGIL